MYIDIRWKIFKWNVSLNDLLDCAMLWLTFTCQISYQSYMCHSTFSGPQDLPAALLSPPFYLVIYYRFVVNRQKSLPSMFTLPFFDIIPHYIIVLIVDMKVGASAAYFQWNMLRVAFFQSTVSSCINALSWSTRKRGGKTTHSASFIPFICWLFWCWCTT